jgi:glutaredoxin
MEYLEKRKIEYHLVDVRGDASRMQTLKDLSGQSKTPTLDWDGTILADFGIAELEPFLRERAAASQQ